MDNLFAQLNATERFQQAVRGMSHHRWSEVDQLYRQAPMVTWTSLDPGFQQRLRAAEIITRGAVGDLNQLWVRQTLLAAFEHTLRHVEELVQTDLAAAWALGFHAAGAQVTPNTPPDPGLAQLGPTGQIPSTVAELQSVQTTLATYWRAWADFVQDAWHLAPEEPIRAWFPDDTDHLITTIQEIPAIIDHDQQAAFRAPLDQTWNLTLASIAQTGLG